MSVCVIRWVVGASCLAAAVFAAPQEGTPELRDTSPGDAISIPLPTSRMLDLQKYEIPELAGAEVARGSYLVDGKLPRPVADYVASMAGIRQRLSIFENGVVSISMKGTGGTIRKRLIIPPDALAAYKEALDAESLMEAPDHVETMNPTKDYASLRIYRPDGSVVERKFNPTVVQNIAVGKPTMILNDLLRALSEDREATSSLTGYKPRVGDQLIADDEQIYRIVRIVGEGKYVELMSTREPLTLYVAVKDLHNYFIGRRRSSRHNE